jgi:hypothetical protein
VSHVARVDGAACDDADLCNGRDTCWNATCTQGEAPNPNDGNNLTLQVRGKAYPTIRELRLARTLGDSGVVGSICPRTFDTNSPDFGYRPVARALAARAKAVFAAHNQ